MGQKNISDKEVLEYMQTLSNWGRWGKDDELGALNLITDEKRYSAIQLVQDGHTVSCARPWTTDMDEDVSYQSVRFTAQNNSGGALEYIGMVFHGFHITHIDSLGHVFWDGKMYNGYDSSKFSTADGALVSSVQPAKNGIISRAVLLDIAKMKGKKWLDKDEYVYPEDLTAAEKYYNVSVRSGDILLVRTGEYKRRCEEGPVDPQIHGATGCHVRCTPWFKERDIAMIGTDTFNEILPYYALNTGVFHTVSMVAMGLWVLDNPNFEDVTDECEKRSKWEFMLSINPLNLKNCTGSPVNPIAVF